ERARNASSRPVDAGRALARHRAAPHARAGSPDGAGAGPGQRRRPMKVSGVAFVLALTLASVSGSAQVAGSPNQPPAGAGQDLPPIRNFLKVTPDFCTGGQPRIEHFEKLKADGVKAVLNLRTPGEHRADEEQAAVEKLGMKYFNVPVVYMSPTDAEADE